MLEGYKPIDFSSAFPPMDLGQMRNRVGLSQAAMSILANSEWKSTSLSSLSASRKSGSGEVPKRKQTLFGRAIDLLSTPAYMVANAADDALAGHQSNDHDSVLEDALQIIGGAVTGAGRGIGTGLRGAFAPSEIAADPQDKQYLGDFLIRLDTHMSAEDALNPENREQVRKRLMGKKMNQLSNDPRDHYFYDWDKGVVEVTDEDIDQYFKDMELWGLGASIVADPLNFIKGPSGFMSGAKGSAEIPEIASGSRNIYEGFKSLPEGSAARNIVAPQSVGLGALGKSSGSYKVTLPPGAIQNKIASPTGELITPPAWFDFPASPAGMDITRTPKSVSAMNEIDPLDDILGNWASGRATKDTGPKYRDELLPAAKAPDEQIKAANKLSDPKDITKLTGDLLRRAATGDANWANNLLERLATKYPGANFERTTKLIEHVAKIPNFSKRLTIPAERKKIVGAFNRVIYADAQAMKIPPKIDSASDIINKSTGNPVNLASLVENAKISGTRSKNPVRDSKVVDSVYNKFKDPILGSGTPSGLRAPEAWSRKVASGENVRYSGPQQVQMWNYITSVLLKDIKTPSRFNKARTILRQVEARFISDGAIPMSSFKTKNSIPLRLSQVLDAIGPAAAAMDKTLLTRILRGDVDALKSLNSSQIAKLEELKAGEALVDASSLVKGVDAASKQIEDLIKGPLSASRMEEIVTIGSKVADDITQASGGSPVAGAKAAAITREEFIPKSPVDSAIKSSNLNTTALISHPNVSGNLLNKYSNAPSVARAINKSIGGPTPKQLGTMVGPAARAIEWLGARFNAAYKNADMRPIYLENAATAKATVAKRAEYLNNLAKQYDVNDADLWNDALKAAQGRLEPLPGSPSAELSKEIIQVMENLFGSSGLKSSVVVENSVVGRSQLLMGELNRNLRRFGLREYQFTKKGDYSEGIKWLNSWESWEIKRPLEFLFKVQNVVEHTVREKIMFDEIAARFGSYEKVGEFSHKVSHPRLSNVYFGKEAASQVNQFIRNLKEISQTSSKPLQHFDKILSKWKAAVTIYVPSHHIRNLLGDTYFNWVAGVNSTRPYEISLKVMRSQKGRYEGLEEIGSLADPNTLKKLIADGQTPGATGKDIAFTMKNGTKVTNDMVYVGLFQQGVLPTTRVLEDIPDDVITGLDKFRPLGGKGQKTFHSFSESRDHFVRIAHAIDVMKKSNKSFEKALGEAAATVRKWHPDGMDLTAFERNVMRRMFPFYSWTRKAIPLIIESMVAAPGKTMVYPKAQYLLQNMLGIETGPMSDPFPYDQLFPDWIRERGIGPMMAGDIPLVGGMLGESDDYTVVNPSNPTLDIIAELNHPGKMAMGMLNPAARIPIELATGSDAQTGAPNSGITDFDYMIRQIPGLSHAGRVTGEFGVSDSTKERSSGYNMQNIINLLTALGIQNTKPYIKSAEFDLRDYLKGL